MELGQNQKVMIIKNISDCVIHWSYLVHGNDGVADCDTWIMRFRVIDIMRQFDFRIWK